MMIIFFLSVFILLDKKREKSPLVEAEELETEQGLFWEQNQDCCRLVLPALHSRSKL